MNGEKKHIIGDDNELFSEIGTYMKARFDIEDVKNDPFFTSARDSVKEMISDYNRTISENRKTKENGDFIRNSIEKTDEKEIKDPKDKREINEIIIEKGRSDISILTADWVREWHRKKQMEVVPDPKAEERMEFISASLKSEPAEIVEEIKVVRKKRIGRTLYIRYISLSAAAIIGAVILIGTLLPSSDPDKLFNSYYTTFDAISPVTRGGSDITEASTTLPLFFTGLASIEQGNFSEAIRALSLVASDSGEYVKEAQWYLGLAYLKTGDKVKAAECFGKLAASPGFYSDPSKKLLRRLK
jgi:TolA-binding protein